MEDKTTLLRDHSLLRDAVNREPIIPRRGLRAETDAEIAAWLTRHRRGLVRTATAILHDRDQAEDVVQSTLLRVWTAVSRSEVRDFAAYVSRAVYWNALKHRARRRSDVSLEAIDPKSAGGAGGRGQGAGATGAGTGCRQPAGGTADRDPAALLPRLELS